MAKIKIQQLLFDLEFQKQPSGHQPPIANGHSTYSNAPLQLNNSFPGPSNGEYLLQDSHYFPQYSHGLTESANNNSI